MAKKASSISPRLLDDKNQLLIYSLFLAFGSVSIYVFVNAIYTMYQGIIWTYTISFVINAGLITLVSLVVGFLFLLACLRMVQGKTYSWYPAIISSIILIGYPLAILFLGSQMPASFEHFLFLLIPTSILLIILVILWKKYGVKG
ncbi:MAG: hypothetical protein KKC68_07295 [Candidatus Thermoplasmatota archaeon]|nr:hypothetical protein [Candidatus Thermoplasmatota archaeon]MBU1941564.1 hypothetical protein [Candidatus Thermoplasmatota archaeon]